MAVSQTSHNTNRGCLVLAFSAFLPWYCALKKKKKILFIYLFPERGERREKQGEKHGLVDSQMHPNQGLNPWTRYVPSPGIEQATFCFVGWCPTNWALVSAVFSFIVQIQPISKFVGSTSYIIWNSNSIFKIYSKSGHFSLSSLPPLPLSQTLAKAFELISPIPCFHLCQFSLS